MAPQATAASYKRAGLFWEVMAAYRCDHCGKLLLAAANLPEDPGPTPSQVFNAIDYILDTGAPVTWLPRSGEAKAFPDVPDHIASAASEAYECFSIGAYRAAISLSRAVVEATAKHLGFGSGSLSERITNMVEGTHLRSTTGEMAHEVRHWGNDMAHGDFAAPIGHDEAEAVLALMDEVLQETFQGPARLERVRQLRRAAAEESHA
jgi:hypothetical protein